MRQGSDGERFARFGVAARIEHWLLVVTFVLLAATGLPQMFADSRLGGALLRWLGGLQRCQAVHRTVAVVFGAGVLLHSGELLYKLVTRGRRMAMLPGWQDVRDFFQDLAHNFGRSATRPRFGRYSYAEKMEYWSLIWGALVMGLTGLLMWNVDRTAAVVPFTVVPVARAIHGYEAILAVLAVLTWHVYHVHIRHFNRSMFRGWLSRREMEEFHPLELSQLEAARAHDGSAGNGGQMAPVSPRRRRLAVALSVAVVLGSAVLAVWWARAPAPVEEATVGVPVVREISAPSEWGPPVPHPVRDRADCLKCHGKGCGVEGPAFIFGLTSSTCGNCHEQGHVSVAARGMAE